MRVGGSGLPYLLVIAIPSSSGLTRQRETAYNGRRSCSMPGAVASGGLGANLSFPTPVSWLLSKCFTLWASKSSSV